jgi:hypothetical protein
MSTPDDRTPDDDRTPAEAGQEAEGSGAEIGVSEGDGSTFEPEEDPEAHG